MKFLEDPGEARGCSTNSLMIKSVILFLLQLYGAAMPKRLEIALQVKIDYVIVIKNFLNPEGHQNPISGSKVTALLLKGLI